jgi:hypothetical protein
VSDLAATRAAIVATLSGVADIGRVHSFERYDRAEKDLKALYLYEGRLQGWFVRRLSTRVISPAKGIRTVINRWRIRGYRALDDSVQSEILFDATIEAIRAAFDASSTLGGVVETTHVDDLAGIQLEDSSPVMFASVLCHGARLALSTRHRER